MALTVTHSNTLPYLRCTTLQICLPDADYVWRSFDCRNVSIELSPQTRAVSFLPLDENFLGMMKADKIIPRATVETRVTESGHIVVNRRDDDAEEVAQVPAPK